jgi:hypothetical protein
MSQTYDIGIGRCSGIEGELVYVRLDSLIAKRLAPDAPWNRSGISVLRCHRKYCSPQRPPTIDEELFLASTALSRPARAEIDISGNGTYRAIDLNVILTSMTPVSPAPASVPGAKLAFPRRTR